MNSSGTLQHNGTVSNLFDFLLRSSNRKNSEISINKKTKLALRKYARINSPIPGGVTLVELKRLKLYATIIAWASLVMVAAYFLSAYFLPSNVRYDQSYAAITILTFLVFFALRETIAVIYHGYQGNFIEAISLMAFSTIICGFAFLWAMVISVGLNYAAFIGILTILIVCIYPLALFNLYKESRLQSIRFKSELMNGLLHLDDPRTIMRFKSLFICWMKTAAQEWCSTWEVTSKGNLAYQDLIKPNTKERNKMNLKDALKKSLKGAEGLDIDQIKRLVLPDLRKHVGKNMPFGEYITKKGYTTNSRWIALGIIVSLAAVLFAVITSKTGLFFLALVSLCILGSVYSFRSATLFGFRKDYPKKYLLLDLSILAAGVLVISFLWALFFYAITVSIHDELNYFAAYEVILLFEGIFVVYSHYRSISKSIKIYTDMSGVRMDRELMQEPKYKQVISGYYRYLGVK